MTIIQFDGRRRRKISPVSANSLFNTHIPLFSDDIFVEYTKARLLQGPQVVNIVLPSGIDRSLFNKAFLALATTFFGVEHKEKGILSQGLLQYGDALSDVHKALGDPSRRNSYDLLESIAVMTLFEVPCFRFPSFFLISDNEYGWLSHTEGLERLISLRGSESFKTYPNYIILQNYRPSIILSCILLRKHTILSKPEWKSIPWSLYPDAKTDMQFLVDILADCPGLFVQREEIESSSPPSDRSVGYAKLRKNISDVLDQLNQWEQNWEKNNTGYSYEVPSPVTTPILVDSWGRSVPAWETVIEYESLYHANTVVVYHATVILVQVLANQLVFSNATPLYSQNEGSFPDRTFAAGLAICRSVEYHLQSMRKGAGSFFLLFPLRMAYDAIGRTNPQIGVWLQSVLQQIQDGKTGRWGTAKYLLDIKPQRKRMNAPGFI
ncbi:hypothetical protein PISL3812_04062 [Talaromyces islandicus]|uniref:Uncharacterized protein n=1 Tax=Talaromyces islandicus TaxID=28573 RepID=A0A0U1LUG8_TALIS|nr:hypothetical protein PISL3812_04062 [Talaromyces islandicus]